jgi:hypothetical protein
MDCGRSLAVSRAVTNLLVTNNANKKIVDEPGTVASQ